MRQKIFTQPSILSKEFLTQCAVTMSLAFAATTAWAVTDGFGDGDRNNNGAITIYDTDANLNGMIDPDEVSTPEDAADVGLIWAATRGFTSSNTGDAKGYITIIDDSAGLGSGYALNYEAKGAGSSAAGFLSEPVVLGPNVGDRVVVSVDFRVTDTSPDNPGAVTPQGTLRWGLFQDTDGQFGLSNDVGRDVGGTRETVVWGDDTGENDGEWRGADPGPVGDKGLWANIPIGLFANPENARIRFENNTSRFLEGSDIDTVASPTGDGPGGGIGIGDMNAQLDPHELKLEIIRTMDSVEVATFVNGVELLRDEVDPMSDLGAAPDSFDYIAFRNTQPSSSNDGGFPKEDDFDFVIDNVSIIPEPASAAMACLAGCLLLWRMRRR